jgi:hypothetical protein
MRLPFDSFLLEGLTIVLAPVNGLVLHGVIPGFVTSCSLLGSSNEMCSFIAGM